MVKNDIKKSTKILQRNKFNSFKDFLDLIKSKCIGLFLSNNA